MNPLYRKIDNTDILAELGVTPVINVGGTKSWYGGSPVRNVALKAIEQVRNRHVDLRELNEAVGKRIANWVGAEAGLVTNGAASGTVLAAGILVARGRGGKDLESIGTCKTDAEVIVMRHHRGQYSFLLEQTGVRIREVGFINRCEAKHIQAVLTDRTVGIMFLEGPGVSQIGPDLESVLALGKSNGVPVFVSAAAMLPPKSNLYRYGALGVDLVTISGGKYIGSTQTSGVLLGKEELISVGRELVFPNLALGRAHKVSKEDIVALYAAIKHLVETDDAAELNALQQRVQETVERISLPPGVKVRAVEDSQEFFIPSVLVEFAGGRVVATKIRRGLLNGNPRVFLRNLEHRGCLVLDPCCATEDEWHEAVQALEKIAWLEMA